MPFTISQATVVDAPGIAAIFASHESSGFSRLQLGSVDPGELLKDLNERITRSITEVPDQIYVIAKDDETGSIVSYSQWLLPKAVGEEVEFKSEEQEAKDVEEWRKKLSTSFNIELMVDFRLTIHAMRARVLQSRRHYLLQNLGTLPSYERKGAASSLVSWIFDRADREDTIVYLDTDAHGHARSMYERLGFVECGGTSFELEKYGGSGAHTHIAMVREPVRDLQK